jgi:hypothetical protein
LPLDAKLNDRPHAPLMLFAPEPLEEGHSGQSNWVAIERDAALRAGKPVFAFYPSTGEFRQDTGQPKRPNIHAVYAPEDAQVVEDILQWMRDYRNFNIEAFSPFEWDDQGEYVSDVMDFSGGDIIAFIRRETISELPMQIIRLAYETDEGAYIGIQQSLRLACLDPLGDWIEESILQYVTPGLVIDLTDKGNTRPWSANRLDDLIVRIIGGHVPADDERGFPWRPSSKPRRNIRPRSRPRFGRED